MHSMLPAGADIDYRWHGLICYTRSLRPPPGCLDEDPSVYFGFGYHGNGVNTATWTGKQHAHRAGQGSAPPIPAIVKGLCGRFSQAALRLKLLQLGIGISTLLDYRSQAGRVAGEAGPGQGGN